VAALSQRGASRVKTAAWLGGLSQTGSRSASIDDSAVATIDAQPMESGCARSGSNSLVSTRSEMRFVVMVEEVERASRVGDVMLKGAS
jgi:hypothetical protein